MYDELVKRLRDKARLVREYNDTGILEDKAADAIEELSMKLHGDESAIAGMKREIERMVVSNASNTLNNDAMRWIPVSERLPENDKTVLVWNRRNSREYFDVCDHGRWIILRQEDITHWMPLPEPPKEEA